jgi:hypothetical protein
VLSFIITIILVELQSQHPDKDVYIIGGASLFRDTQDIVERVLLTRFTESYDCNVVMEIDSYLENFSLVEQTIKDSGLYQIWKKNTSLQTVLDKGTTKEDRTGTGTISVFGMQQRYDLTKGFPAVTTKKLAWKSVLVNCCGSLKEQVMNIDCERFYMVAGSLKRQPSGLPMPQHLIGNLRQSMKATWVVYMAYNGDIGVHL